MNYVLDRLYRIVTFQSSGTVGIVILISLFGFLLLVLLTIGRLFAGNILPPEKQAIEDRYTQERLAGYQSPAPKDPQGAAPSPGPEVQYLTGIIEGGDAPFSPEDVIITNRWQDIVSGDLLIVYAGGLSDDPAQGLVILSRLSDDPSKVAPQRFVTPVKGGPVAITSARNLQLSLVSDSGATFVFDVTSGTFNLPPTLAIPGDQTVQYSDALSFSISTSDPEASDTLVLSASGLPSSLTFTDNGNRTGTVTGTTQVPAGTYPVTFSVDDGHNPPVTAGLNIIVTRENAIVAPSASNPIAVRVNTAGGTAGPVTLTAAITEATDESSNGNISNAIPVTFTVQPVGSGSVMSCIATTSGGGVGGTLTASCTFNNVPVNVYDVHITIGGNFYQGAGDGVLAVFDPSLGFTTGGGTVLHNGVLANLGFNAKYLKSGQIQGSLLYIEHRASGDVILKSNAIGSLSIVKNSATSYTAILLGKATLNGVGNYSFQLMATDNGEPGTSDQFGLQVKDPGGAVVPDLTFAPLTLAGGNIQVPHK